MPPMQRKHGAQLDEDYDKVDDSSDDMSEDEDFDEFVSSGRQSQRDVESNLQAVDDDVLFGFFKKLVCNSFRQIINPGIGPGGARTHTNSNDNTRRRTAACGPSDARARKTVTKLNVTYFSDIVQSLDPHKSEVIEEYGFGSLLLFARCAVPLPFSCWIADHIQVRSSDIVVRNKSIPISVETVQDVLGLPIGGKTISKSDSDRGKKDFRRVLGLTTLPSFKAFGDHLLKDNISDEEVARSFLIVALVTLLCPNSSIYLSTEYLLPLVDVKSAKEWDWSKFVYNWLMKRIRKYQILKRTSPHDSITLGGCLYLICVVYLDYLVLGPHVQLPSTLPRISVWKRDMIKEFSELDCVQGHIFGKRPILPSKSTCYALRVAGRTPSHVCSTDISEFKKHLLERIPGTFSPQSLDDITALYAKHAAAVPNEMPAVFAKSIIVDVIEYFFHRSQRDKSYENIQSRNNGEASVSRPSTNNDARDNSINKDSDSGQFFDDYNDNGVAYGGSPVQVPEQVLPSIHTSAPVLEPNVVSRGEKEMLQQHTQSMDTDEAVQNQIPCQSRQPSDGCEPIVSKPANACCNTILEDIKKCDSDITPPQIEQFNVVMSGDTELVPSSGGGTQSFSVSVAETEKVSSSSPDVPSQEQFSKGYSQRKKRRLSDPTSLSDGAGDSVATRTRSRQNSLSPTTVGNQDDIIDKPESFLRKMGVKRLATRNRKSPLCWTDEIHVVADDLIHTIKGGATEVAVEESTNKANGPHLLTSNTAVLKARQHLPKIVTNQKLKERLYRKVNGSVSGTTSTLKDINHGSPAVETSCSLNLTNVVDPIPQCTATKSPCEVARAFVSEHVHDGLLNKIRNLVSDAIDKGAGIAASPISAQKSSAKSASFDYLLIGDISSHGSRHLQPPSQVNTYARSVAVAESSSACEAKTSVSGAGLCSKIPKRKLTAAEKITMWDIPAPSFSLGLEFEDDDNFINTVHDYKPAKLPNNGKHVPINSSHHPNLEERTSVSGSATRHCSSSAYQPSSSKAPTSSHSHKSGSSNPDKDKANAKDVCPILVAFHRKSTRASNSSRELTPEPVPITEIDSQENVLLPNSTTPLEVEITGHRIVDLEKTPEVVITGETNFKSCCGNMSQEANNLYNDSQRSCFKKCEMIGFKLGSSSKGQFPRRKRRILKPNSYYRDFLTNACTARIHSSLQEKMAYDCLIFYCRLPEYANKNLINYGKVCVTYHELGSSLDRGDKTVVHNHVINALCHKLFKERHPTLSGRHYFFSTVGDYLIGTEGTSSYQHKMHKNCERCFQHANKCLNFMSSDYLIFPILHTGHWFVFIVALRDGYFVFLDSSFDENSFYQQQARSIIIPNFVKAWDEFIGYNYDFQDFVIHYAQVPKLDKKYWSKHDDGIFVMKYLELWDPYVNMMVQFQSSNISDIRVKYVSDMVFSRHNDLNSEKEVLANFEAMIKLKHATNFQPASSFAL